MAYFALTAVGTERVVDPNTIGVALVLVCYAQATQSSGEAIETAIRVVHSDAQRVVVAHVIDLHSVPRMFRGVAESILRNEYAKAVDALAEGQTPYDYTIALPDWDGAAIANLGLNDVDKHPALAIFAPPGRLLGADHGDEPAVAALRMLKSLD